MKFFRFLFRTDGLTNNANKGKSRNTVRTKRGNGYGAHEREEPVTQGTKGERMGDTHSWSVTELDEALEFSVDLGRDSLICDFFQFFSKIQKEISLKKFSEIFQENFFIEKNFYKKNFFSFFPNFFKTLFFEKKILLQNVFFLDFLSFFRNFC